MRILPSLFFLFLLVSCASRPVQTELVTADRSLTTRQHEISAVPFVNQSVGHCGPATLTMLFQYHGKPADANQVASTVLIPGMKGSLQTDMISAARRQGFMAVPISGFHSLIKEIADNHPVIVFENLGLSWYPQWHYAVVYGFDLDKKTLALHTGPSQDQTVQMKHFEQDWMLGDYWGLVILKPGDVALSASEFQNSSAATALEAMGFYDSAEKSYRRILQEWPNSLVALMGMGNLEYRKQNLSRALYYFRQAQLMHPQSLSAKKNVAVLEKALKVPATF